MKKTNISKNIYNQLGDVIGVATSVDLKVSYTVGEPYAIGYYKFYSADETFLVDGNKHVPLDGWGEDDTVIYDNFLKVLGV